jgi:hypothetical protein
VVACSRSIVITEIIGTHREGLERVLISFLVLIERAAVLFESGRVERRLKANFARVSRVASIITRIRSD